MKNNTRGFTLIELLITVSIAAILINVAAPSFYYIYQNAKSNAVTQRLTALINLARIHALNTQQYTTLCPTVDFINCSNDCSTVILLF